MVILDAIIAKLPTIILICIVTIPVSMDIMFLNILNRITY
jgi:hypothetical protein